MSDYFIRIAVEEGVGGCSEILVVVYSSRDWEGALRGVGGNE